MIITKIIGGLGNQMFQYAAGKALAELHNTTLKVDISEFHNYELRNFELMALKKDLFFATEKEIIQWKATNTLQRLRERVKKHQKKKFYKEPFFHYDNNFQKLGANVYIQGYFQSEKYFFSIKDLIRKEFDFSHLKLDRLRELSNLIRQKQSVAVHIRKGDYQNAKALKVHGVLSVEYYGNAMAYLKNKLNQPEFYIFSDAPEKAQADLQLPEATIISGKETSNHFQDLYLMSQCRHNIIANSSFSWWGAWLNANPEKVVIGPKNWFNQGPKDTYDIMPESWIKI